MLKISDLYLDKQKSVISKKNVPWIALFSANRWRLDVLTFLIKGSKCLRNPNSLEQDFIVTAIDYIKSK